MDQGWGWFNVVTMGMRDVCLKGTAGNRSGSEITDPEELEKLENMCVASPIVAFSLLCVSPARGTP